MKQTWSRFGLVAWVVVLGFVLEDWKSLDFLRLLLR